MSTDAENSGKKATGGSKSPGLLAGQWRKFGAVLAEPWTLIMLVSAVILFAIGQWRLAAGANALVQTLLAVVSGVLGGRIANQMTELAGQSVLVARGRVAVRGLRLMLVQTGAFERRLALFLDRRKDIESNPDLTERNYEEAIEFCRRIQEEAASAIETWGDILPGTDLSTLIGRITELNVEHDATKAQLEDAQAKLNDNLVSGTEAAHLRGTVRRLERYRRDQQVELEALRAQLKTAAGAAAKDEAVSSEVLLRRAAFLQRMMSRQRNSDSASGDGTLGSVDSDDKK